MDKWDYVPEVSAEDEREFLSFCREYGINPQDDDAWYLFGEACEYSDTLRTLPY